MSIPRSCYIFSFSGRKYIIGRTIETASGSFFMVAYKKEIKFVRNAFYNIPRTEERLNQTII